MAVSELDLQLEFYINGVAILIVASLGILGNVLSLLLFKFRYFRVGLKRYLTKFRLKMVP